MGSQARNRSDSDAGHIKTLRYTIIGLVAVEILTVCLCFYLSRNIDIWVRPSMSEGGRVDVNSVPKTYIHEFGLKMWKLLNHWEENGEMDFKNNIHRYQNYFTPSCRRSLNKTYEKLLDDGDIQYRRRTMSTLIDKTIFDPSDVKKDSNGVWTIALHTNLLETLHGTTLKNLDITYVMQVVYFDVDESVNPWGLAIDCSNLREHLIKDHLAGRSE